MQNKTISFLVIIFGLLAISACRQQPQPANNAPSPRDETSYKETGKEWRSFALEETDIKVDLPGAPADRSAQVPIDYRNAFNTWHLYAYDDKDLSVAVLELVPNGKRIWQMKDLPEVCMTALKRGARGLNFTSDIKSETNAKYNGTFTRNGKIFDVRGCCVYKKGRDQRAWAVMTSSPQDNEDARSAAQRAIDSIVFKGSSEKCK